MRRMITLGHPGTRMVVVVGIGLAALGSVAACGSTSEPAESPSAGSSSERASTAAAPPAVSVSVAGSWVADASALVAANTSNLGGTGTMHCTGPITLTFSADERFTNTGTATCTVGGRGATGNISSAGSYTSDRDTLTFSDVSNNGSLAVGGTTMPFEGGISNGIATYSIAGNTLTIRFNDPTVGNVVQEWQRQAG